MQHIYTQLKIFTLPIVTLIVPDVRVSSMFCYTAPSKQMTVVNVFLLMTTNNIYDVIGSISGNIIVSVCTLYI